MKIQSSHTIEGNPWKLQGGRKILGDMQKLFGGNRTSDFLNPLSVSHELRGKSVVADAYGWAPSSVSVSPNTENLTAGQIARANAALEAYKAKLGMKFAGHVALEATGAYYGHVLGVPDWLVERKHRESITMESLINSVNQSRGVPHIQSTPLERAKQLHNNLGGTSAPIFAAPAEGSPNKKTVFFAEGPDYRYAVGSMAYGLEQSGLIHDTVDNDYPAVFGYRDQRTFAERWTNAMETTTPLAAAQVMLQTETANFRFEQPS